MRQCMDAENLHRRLKKIIGQVQAIDRMVDEDVPCEDILSQINAAKSALHRHLHAPGVVVAHPHAKDVAVAGQVIVHHGAARNGSEAKFLAELHRHVEADFLVVLAGEEAKPDRS